MKWMNCLLAGAALVLAGPAIGADAACDRQCLIDLSDRYVAALVAHDPQAVPLAAGLKTVENLKRIKPGEGLWQSLGAGPDQFVIHVPDPVSQEVGIMLVAKNAEARPVMFGIRLKLDASGKIVEAEHLIGNPLSDAQLANLQVPRAALTREVPYEYADSRGRMIWLGKSYYDALDDGNSQESAMADDCERHENGFQTARNPMVRPASGPVSGQGDPVFAYLGGLGCAAQMDTNMWEYISTIANRRVEIADPVTGLVWGMSHFHHDFTKQDFKLIGVPGSEVRHMTNKPFDMPAIHIYKVWGGKIHEIEAVGLTTSYMSPTGWEE